MDQLEALSGFRETGYAEIPERLVVGSGPASMAPATRPVRSSQYRYERFTIRWTLDLARFCDFDTCLVRYGPPSLTVLAAIGAS